MTIYFRLADSIRALAPPALTCILSTGRKWQAVWFFRIALRLCLKVGRYENQRDVVSRGSFHKPSECKRLVCRSFLLEGITIPRVKRRDSPWPNDAHSTDRLPEEKKTDIAKLYLLARSAIERKVSLPSPPASCINNLHFGDHSGKSVVTSRVDRSQFSWSRWYTCYVLVHTGIRRRNDPSSFPSNPLSNAGRQKDHGAGRRRGSWWGEGRMAERRRGEEKRSVNEPTDHTPALLRGTSLSPFTVLLLDEFLHTGRGTWI